HHLLGYAEIYLGANGKRIMFFATVFGIYSALLAYLIGEGQSLSTLFFGNLDYSIYFGIGFWFLMTFLLSEKARNLKKIESFGVTIIVLVILVLLFQSFDQINLNNLLYVDTNNFWVPFGIVLFALLGFSAIPEMRIELRGKEKLLRNAIVLGTAIPVVLYFIFTFVFVGVLGKDIVQVSTISFGVIAIVLGIFTMFGSYFVLSFALKDIFLYDLHKKGLIFISVSVLPLLIYLLVAFLDIVSFIQVLEIGGIISGGITGIMIMLINMKAKKKGNRKSEYSVPINWIIVAVLSAVCIAGMVFVFI
ncbi:hypothetical protein HYT24_02585, partial [Candidatus Pacearchaeota archaeon]|nr:hypothetical protein [Candidatus Pacearchaeota archaeon]